MGAVSSESARESCRVRGSAAGFLVFFPCASSLLVFDSNLRQTFTALVEIANFYQRWPQFDRTFDHTDDVVHDPQQVLLEKVRLEAIEGLLKVGTTKNKSGSLINKCSRLSANLM
jgi:hypothetical protein